ncbi:MAG: aspartate--tRNA ligase [bacterium]
MQPLKRSCTCGAISEKLVGKEICVAGWINKRRDHGGVVFIDLRDQSGILQLVFNPEQLDAKMMELVASLRLEYVIIARGVLMYRAQGMVNPKMATGAFELKVTQVSILGQSKALPFQLDQAEGVSEDLRLKYRYLDLRRPDMQKILKLRHDVSMIIREFLNERGFLEIETPILSKSTPEGARDFLVPARIPKGTFYALPQSPQLYKQLLMCSGIEKYFQIARCFRDEDLRADRQPEFTQLDMEMSFVDEGDIFEVCESLLSELFKKISNITLSLPFKRYAYDEVFGRFGVDKPDMRYVLEINNVTKLFESVDLKFLQSVLSSGGRVGALCVKDHQFSRSELDGWVEKVTKEYGAKGLMWIAFEKNQTPKSSIAKFLPQDFFAQAKTYIPDLTTQDTLFVIAGDYREAWSVLGKLRIELANALQLIDTLRHEMFWVIDFPMFEWDKETKRWYAAHHPFTSPQQGWEALEPGQVKARAYDLVWNGYEIAGGSIRIHDSNVQQKIFEILGMSQEVAQRQFGFLLEAQNFGYPPEGGVAFGLDRLVMNLAGTESIRDVIAFPKTQRRSCLMMENPSIVEDEQLKELGIKVVTEKKE